MFVIVQNAKADDDDEEKQILSAFTYDVMEHPKSLWAVSIYLEFNYI